MILYVPSTILQVNKDGSSWVEPVLTYDKCVLLKDHNPVTPVRLEPAALGLESNTPPLSHFAPRYEGLSKSSWTNCWIHLKICKYLFWYHFERFSKFHKNINNWVFYRQLIVVMYNDVPHIKISLTSRRQFSPSTHLATLSTCDVTRFTGDIFDQTTPTV